MNVFIIGYPPACSQRYTKDRRLQPAVYEGPLAAGSLLTLIACAVYNAPFHKRIGFTAFASLGMYPINLSPRQAIICGSMEVKLRAEDIRTE
jgi:hypothetical protein